MATKELTDLKELTRKLVNDTHFDDCIDVYLNLAMEAVVNRLFPFENDATYADVPEKYHCRTAQIACYLINKQGAEGETTHSENGVSRIYGSANIPPAYFVGMNPKCGLIK